MELKEPKLKASAKHGFKHTEVGVIPEDWKVRPLQACLREKPSYGINAAAVPFSLALPAYIRITDITDEGRYQPQGKVCVNHPHASSYFLMEGDLVLARTGASVGKAYRYRATDGPLVYAGFLIKVTPDPSILLPGYLEALLRTDYYRNWITVMSMRSGQPGINGQEYGILLLPIPSPAEQHAIATALSDVDGLIAGLEGLLAKKRALKQGAMQQLLSGQKRLPGFTGEWGVKTFGEVAGRIIGGGTPSRSVPEYWGHEIPWVAVKDFATFNPNGTQEWITKAGLVNSASHLIPKGSLIVATRIALGQALIYDVDVAINQDLKGVLSSEKLNARFMYYWFQQFGSVLIDKGAGSTVLGILLSDLKQLEIFIPSQVKEQTAIATVLSDMDAELGALEAKLGKTRLLKQGMMQELLTGKTRLV
jgi:type I restriction enzyme S subunit